MRCGPFRLAAVLIAVMLPAPASSHGGGLDDLGCHHNRKQGGYHCHRGPLAGKAFSSKAEALEALGASKPQRVEPPAAGKTPGR